MVQRHCVQEKFEVIREVIRSCI